jgi:hypothetical protein
MSPKTLMLASLLACAFAQAAAADRDQQADPPHTGRGAMAPHGDTPMFHVGALDALRTGAGFMFGPHMQHRQVKNAPYSAQVVMERQQNLADGNQIVNKKLSSSYRDSAGRTRQEVRDANGDLRSATIHDPVAGTTYILHPQTKTATKVPSSPEAARAAAEGARAAGEAARAHVEQLRREGKLPTVEHRSGPGGEEIIIKRVERAGNGGAPEDVRVRVEKNLAGPAVAGAFGDMKWASKATTRELGSREIEGVKAEGKLRSYEIPAGEVGNRNPIVVSDETWYAPELQVTVYSKHSDPRLGDTIFRLQGLKRDEPAAALFTVPADYTVKDVMASLTRKLEPKTP